ncbi:universal stress protein [Haloplanus salilacus]|uniref:universal stress protein n=1 Tax=Haloplanus salilacus TaxID=2949994 RepID=UPI0030CF129D
MTIVACVDRSEHATEIIAEAVRLGEAFDDRIHAVHVLSKDEFVDLQQTSVKDTGAEVSAGRIESLAAEIAADALADAGASGEAVGLVGDPASEIVGYAADLDARYVVLGGRNQSRVGKALFGSVAQSVLLDSALPAVLVRSTE